MAVGFLWLDAESGRGAQLCAFFGRNASLGAVGVAVEHLVEVHVFRILPPEGLLREGWILVVWVRGVGAVLRVVGCGLEGSGRVFGVAVGLLR
jgi:hypothetical protein